MFTFTFCGGFLLFNILSAIKKPAFLFKRVLYYKQCFAFYWQASHSANSLGSIGQTIGLSQASSLILFCSGTFNTLLLIFIFTAFVSLCGLTKLCSCL